LQKLHTVGRQWPADPLQRDRNIKRQNNFISIKQYISNSTAMLCRRDADSPYAAPGGTEQSKEQANPDKRTERPVQQDKSQAMLYKLLTNCQI
jgi:hypothetical protein